MKKSEYLCGFGMVVGEVILFLIFLAGSENWGFFAIGAFIIWGLFYLLNLQFKEMESKTKLAELILDEISNNLRKLKPLAHDFFLYLAKEYPNEGFRFGEFSSSFCFSLKEKQYTEAFLKLMDFKIGGSYKYYEEVLEGFRGILRNTPDNIGRMPVYPDADWQRKIFDAHLFFSQEIAILRDKIKEMKKVKISS